MTKSASAAFRFFEPGGEPQGIEDDALRRARSAIDKLKRAYLREWAPASIYELDRAIRLGQSSPEMAAEHLDMIFRLAHDMKGQGATFGFELISEIGDSLCGMTEGRVFATKAEFDAMHAHAKAAHQVIEQVIEDGDSPEARRVRRDLQAALRACLH